MLTAVMEGLSARTLMVDLDRDVAAFWRAALSHGNELTARVRDFKPTRERIEKIAQAAPRDVINHGFRTLVLNRTRRGGVLAHGASLVKSGENGNGVLSRWYPDTLCKRLEAISRHAESLTFYEGDGVSLLADLADRENSCFFIDPPYTAKGGKRAGKRLYTHNAVEHHKLFEILASSGANFLMTYDCSSEIISLVLRYRFNAAVVKMKNSHHAKLPELVITRERLFT